MRSSAATTTPRLSRLLCRFVTDTNAATAIEYAMVAAGVGAAIAATVYNLGSTLETTLYNKISNAVQ